jgi:hypothetical protein
MQVVIHDFWAASTLAQHPERIRRCGRTRISSDLPTESECCAKSLRGIEPRPIRSSPCGCAAHSIFKRPTDPSRWKGMILNVSCFEQRLMLLCAKRDINLEGAQCHPVISAADHGRSVHLQRTLECVKDKPRKGYVILEVHKMTIRTGNSRR